MSALLSSAQAVTPAGWKDILYSYRNDEHATLEMVLTHFASAMGVELRLADPRLGRRQMLALPERGGSPIVFMDQLAQSQSLDWYVYRGALHVSAQSAGVSERITLGGQTAAAARQALIGLGLFETKFGWGELDTDPPVVVVEGPATYVNAVQRMLEAPKPTTTEPERPRMMVFRLKHAMAQDRDQQVRGTTTKQPGLASVLKELVTPPAQRHADGNALRGTGQTASQNTQTGIPGLTGGAEALSALGALANLSPVQGRDFLSSPLPATALAGTTRKERSDGEGRDKREDSDGLPAIGAYPPLNAVLVWDLPSRRPEYAALIDELDVETRQIEINVTILDVNVNALREWAVDLAAGSGAARVQVNPSGGIGDTGQSTITGGSSMVLWATDRLTLRLRALESRGQAQVLSRPSILTQDNQAAVLDMSQSVYVKLIGERTADLRTVSAGTTLKVTPSVMGEGRDATIRVTLDIDDGALKEGEGSDSPSVGNSSVSTQAVVRPGESLVVGGYRRQNTESTHSRVPGLDSIPLLGWLFRADSVVSNERERLFIVTARVVP